MNHTYTLCRLHFAPNADKTDILCTLERLESADSIPPLLQRRTALGGSQIPPDFLQDRLLVLSRNTLATVPQTPPKTPITSTQLVHLLPHDLATDPPRD
ncbi:MAG: hypothetical protein ACI4X9_02740 [Kiritimatiellia bacterium]